MSASTLDADTILPTILITDAQVYAVQRLSPAFVRVDIGSPRFADIARDEGFDTRIKLIFPGPDGALPEIPEDPEQWYAGWLAMPEAARSPMRTYTIREIVGAGQATRVVIDFVVHEDGDSGPACRWALAARPGDRLQVIAPFAPGIAAGNPYRGTEFQPGTATDILLVGDETALPAIARILADLPPQTRGTAYVEIPSGDDVQPLSGPEHVWVTWLARDGAAYGERVIGAVRRHLGLTAHPSSPPPREPDSSASALDVAIWETRTYSAYGEALPEPADVVATDERYAWVAGESALVKAVRRALVDELGWDRRQVAFMGYWRRGVAMRS